MKGFTEGPTIPITFALLALLCAPAYAGSTEAPDPVGYTSDMVSNADPYAILLGFIEAVDGDDRQDTDATCSAGSKSACANGCRARMANVPGARYLLDAECDVSAETDGNGNVTYVRNCHCVYLGYAALRNFR